MSNVDSLLTWALDGIANVSMFLKLSVGELNFNVLLKTLHTHAVLGLTVKHHHQITAGTCALHVNSLGISKSPDERWFSMSLTQHPSMTHTPH